MLSRRALDVIRAARGPDHPETAAYLASLAGVNQGMGRHAQAEEMYRKALEVYRAAAGPNHPAVAGGLADLAALYLTMGRRDEAEEVYLQAAAVIKNAFGEEHFEYVHALRVLIDFRRSGRNVRAAEPLARRHLEITKRLCPENHPLVAASVQIRAGLERARRDFKAATASYQEALEMVRRSAPENDGMQAPLLKGLALTHLAQGNVPAAEAPLRHALRQVRAAAGEEHPEYAVVLYLLAGVCAAAGREAEALTLLEQTTALGERSLTSVLALHAAPARAAAWQDQVGFTDAYVSLAAQRLADSPEAVERAFDLVLRRKTLWVEMLAACRKSLLEEGRPNRRARIEELYFLGRQAAARRWKGLGAEGLATHERLLADWEGRAARLEAELAESIPELADRKRMRAADCRSVAAVLPEGGALVEFVRSPEWDFQALCTRAAPAAPAARYLAFVLCAGRPDAVKMIDLGPAHVINRLATEYRAVLLGAEGPGRAELVSAAGKTLRAAVFDPATAGLECRHLVLAPDGELVRVPFDALPTDDGAYLIDRYAIHYVHTGRDLLRVGLGGAPADEAATPPVVVGDPNFGEGAETTPADAPRRKDTFWMRLWTAVRRFVTLGVSQPAKETTRSQAAGQFKPLPGTRLEAEQVAALLGVRPGWAARPPNRG